MKKYLTLLCLCLFSLCLCLTGCSQKLNMPTTLDVEYNGGSVVKVGEYTYYANGYKAYGSLKDGDNKNNETISNISRVKTENGKISFDEENKAENTELVAKKVSGFEYSDLYVSGNYLYFTTPNINKTYSNETMFEYVSLFKVKLDGTGLKEVLTVKAEKPSYHFTKISGQDYFFYVEDSILYRVALGKDSQTKVVEDVASIVFSNDNEISNTYYTKAREDSQTGNILKSVNLLTGENSELVNEIGITFTLIGYQNNILFYTRTQSNVDTIYYYNNFSNGLVSEKTLISTTSIADFTILGETVANGIVVSYIYQENLYLDVINDVSYEDQSVLKDNAISKTAKNILGAYGDYVYYLTESGIYRVSYKDGDIQKISSKTDVKKEAFDFDGRYIYFMSTIETEEGKEAEEDTNYYMFMADTHYADLDEESKLIAIK